MREKLYLRCNKGMIRSAEAQKNMSFLFACQVVTNFVDSILYNKSKKRKEWCV